MKKKEIFLEYLKKQLNDVYIPSRKLAEILDVSDRSIRNYVRQINEGTENLIETDRAGYRYNPLQKESAEILDESGVKGRRFHVLRYLFQNAEAGVDCFDLAEELYVSEATIRSDMVALQELVKKYDLKIHQKNFCYFLFGNEKDKRFLITDLIQRPSGSIPYLDKEMQGFLGNILLADLSAFCHRIFSKYHFPANSYFEQNFILHLIVSLNQRNNQLQEDFSSPSTPMIEEINQWLGDFGQSIATGNKMELAILCDGELGHSIRSLKNYVSAQITEVMKKGLKELNDTFLIDFTDERFLTRFLVHTQNLYNRIKSNKVKRNLSIVDIKVQYPILFDIAVYLSAIISKDLQIEISEDEISFLALHIGSFIDEQKNSASRIRTYLETSNYLDNATKTEALLLSKFDNALSFVKNSENAELELSVHPQRIKNAEYVKIHEIVSKQDILHIQRTVEKVKRHRYSNFLKENLPKLIYSETGGIFDDEMTKEEVFEKIGRWFFERDFTAKDFSSKLWEREKMSPTIFSSAVSIPHTLKYDANKTGMLVIQAENEFSWENQKVRLIIALAISPRDSHDFNKIFPRMIECLSDDYHVRRLRDSPDREAFIQQLIQFMLEDDYYDE